MPIEVDIRVCDNWHEGTRLGEPSPFLSKRKRKMTTQELIKLGSELLEEVSLGGELKELEEVIENLVTVEGTDKDNCV